MRRAWAADLGRECLTLVWLVGWGILLWKIHRPWWLLGGWVEPRLFWAERVALYFSPWLGFVFGSWRRRRLLSGKERSNRPWTIVLALLSLFLMLSLWRIGNAGMLGVATTGLCGFAAGGLTAGWGLLLRPEIPDPPDHRPAEPRRPKNGHPQG